jgi:hypothetical protein
MAKPEQVEVVGDGVDNSRRAPSHANFPGVVVGPSETAAAPAVMPKPEQIPGKGDGIDNAIASGKHGLEVPPHADLSGLVVSPPKTAVVCQASAYEPLGEERQVGSRHHQGGIPRPPFDRAATVGAGVPIGEGGAGLGHGAPRREQNGFTRVIRTVRINGRAAAVTTVTVVGDSKRHGGYPPGSRLRFGTGIFVPTQS